MEMQNLRARQHSTERWYDLRFCRFLAYDALDFTRTVYKKLIPQRLRHLRYQLQLALFDYPRFRHFRAEALPRHEFFRRAFVVLSECGIGGDYVEFGCAAGATFRLAHRYARRADHPACLWAFDSFQGLPASNDPRDTHPMWRMGNFSASLEHFLENCRMWGIKRDEFEIVQGFYSDTLSPRSMNYERLPHNIAIAYIDCDMYSSTKLVLDFLAPRLKHGMILAFDDYFYYSSTAIAGERLAFLEFRQSLPHFNFLPFIQYGGSAWSFIVEDRSLFPTGLKTD
jgi:O-methyltransferase